MESNASKRCTLKTSPECDDCLKRAKKKMEKFGGTHTFHVDANEGKVSITSSLDPQMLIEEFAKLGKDAELLWEQQQMPMLNNQTNVNVDHKEENTHKSNSSDHCNNVRDQLNGQQLAQVQELVKNRKMKQVDLSQLQNIKTSFENGEYKILSDDHTIKTPAEIRIPARDTNHTPKAHNETKAGLVDASPRDRENSCDGINKNTNGDNGGGRNNCDCYEKHHKQCVPHPYGPPGHMPPMAISYYSPYYAMPLLLPPPLYLPCCYVPHGPPTMHSCFTSGNHGDECKTRNMM